MDDRELDARLSKIEQGIDFIAKLLIGEEKDEGIKVEERQKE